MGCSNILLVGNYEPDQQKSMLGYAALINSAIQLTGSRDVRLYSPRVFLGRLRFGNKTILKWVRYLDKFIISSVELSILQFFYSRVHICDHSNALYAYVLNKKKITITCHDVIAIQAARGEIEGWRVGFSGRIFQWLILEGIKRAKTVYCVSELTMRDFFRIAEPIQSIVKCAPNALSEPYLQELKKFAVAGEVGCDKKAKTSNDYFLHVGSGLPRKNRIYALQVFSELILFPEFCDSRLIFVGPDPDSAFSDEAVRLNCSNRIDFVSNLPVSALIEYYKNATALIFPSKNEGFGWPIAEAQSCGCPVFASDVPPHPEVGGSAAKYFPLNAPIVAANLIIDSDLNDMRVKGYENALRYDIASFLLKLDL